ncbi:MAG: hypothetical protein OHK0029_02900 [Armatimonadaceae bacterium]
MEFRSSFRSHFRSLSAIALAALGGLILLPVPAQAQEASRPTAGVQVIASDPVSLLMKDLPWRNIGPAIMGGRIDDFAVVESDPATVYAATAAGGVMKTVNHGTTWEMVFDGFETSSIGDVTVAPSDPNIVYVGTGEANNRQSSSWGYGVYRSADAGKTWQHMGLAETHHIGRIVVHPNDPNTAYVAAVGRLWGPNKERGLYKTTDGGKTWEHVLAINEDTGCIDVALDPSNPDTVYAAAYQRRRTAFGFAGGGADAGLYKTTDGGKNWNKVGGGFPTGVVGRIGLAMYHKDPKTIYAIVETRNSGSTQNTAGGSIYRTRDGGETWEKRSDFNPRPMYFSQIFVDPNNMDNVWVLGVQTFYSTDGAKQFKSDRVSRVHADGHALWINPKDSRHMILGTDGGVQWSWDMGRTWDFANNVPISQFYEVAYDFREPYWVYGGLQDNGTWGAPSRTAGFPGVTNDDWIKIAGGDGFYAQVDPKDPAVVYAESQGGAIRRLNVVTGESKSIRPQAEGSEAVRFDWNTPFLISPHNNRKLLVGGNRLFISTDRGDTWRRTNDLTTSPDRDKMPILGKPVTRETLSAHDGQSGFGYIVTLTESPLKEGVLYVGTDDGNLQVSTDDGKTWENVATRLPGVPKGTYVSRVQASHHEAGRCYVALDGHRSDDFKPYVFVTEDFGKTWKPIAANLPEGGTVSVVREHPRTPNLLFVGTERGVFVSFDRGMKWHRFNEPFPASIPVDDIQIHPRDNDLILATHARGIWVLDDLGAFEALAQKPGLSEPKLAAPKPATAWRLASRKGDTGHKLYTAPNPPDGAVLHFYLPTGTEKVRITVLDRDGKRVVRELQPSRVQKGWNRVVWNLRENSPVPPPPPSEEESRGRGTQQNRRFVPSGPRALPGTYTVQFTVGAVTDTQKLEVRDDPRLAVTDRDRQEIHRTATRIGGMYASADKTRQALSATRTRLQEVEKQASGDLKKEVEELVDTLLDLEREIAGTTQRTTQRSTGGSTANRPQQQTGNTPTSASQQTGQRALVQRSPVARQPRTTPLTTRMARLMLSLDSFTEPVSLATRKEEKELSDELKSLLKDAQEVYNKKIASINKKLQANSLQPIKPEPLPTD